MTPSEDFAEGRLAEAVALQETILRERPADGAARFLLVELLAFTGRFDEARSHLSMIESDDPAWPDSARMIRQLFRAERRRSQSIRRPTILPEPIPRHAKARWLAVRLLRDGDPKAALRWIDRAETYSPELRGFIDGREFESLRDADDRFASILEAFVNG
ncbi:MAG TPA: tetratricopeptide repeat protein, partial [Urbifossiella sp.]